MKIKKLIVLFYILSSFAIANKYTHIITYKGIELGAIYDFSTYKKGYLKADITSFVLELIFNRSQFVWHKKGMDFDEDIYEKEEDKFEYLTLMKTTHDNLKNGIYKIKFNEFIGKCDKNIGKIKCTFKDTLTEALGNIVFDDEINILEYSDDDMSIEQIE